MYFLTRLFFKGTDGAVDHLFTSVDSLNNEVLKWLMNFWVYSMLKQIPFTPFITPALSGEIRCWDDLGTHCQTELDVL